MRDPEKVSVRTRREKGTSAGYQDDGAKEDLEGVGKKGDDACKRHDVRVDSVDAESLCLTAGCVVQAASGWRCGKPEEQGNDVQRGSRMQPS